MPGALWSDSPDRGLYKTTDGGKTWNLILKGAQSFHRRLDHRDGSDESEHDVRRHVGFPAQRLDVSVPAATARTSLRAADFFASADGGATWTEITPENEQRFSEETVRPARGRDRALERETRLLLCRIDRQRALRFR